MSRSTCPASQLERLPADQRAAVEQAWSIVNLQADNLLRSHRNATAPWALLASGMAAGGGLVMLMGAAWAMLIHRTLGCG